MSPTSYRTAPPRDTCWLDAVPGSPQLRFAERSEHPNVARPADVAPEPGFSWVSAALQRDDQILEPVVAERRALLHPGPDHHVANLARVVDARGGDPCLALLLGVDGGDHRAGLRER